MKNHTSFRVCPLNGLKMRYYDKLESLVYDFNATELKDCSIGLIINAMVVMYFTSEQVEAVLLELFSC